MKQFITKRYRPERHYMRGPGPMWSRSTAVELLWLVSSWMTTAVTAIYSTSIPSLRDAGAIRGPAKHRRSKK